jgi:hypothetical protein
MAMTPREDRSVCHAFSTSSRSERIDEMKDEGGTGAQAMASE